MKRRILAAVLCCLLLLCGSVVVAGADSAASYVENITTVTSDGECHVTLRVNIHLDAVTERLTFPVPLGATDIELNNRNAKTTRGANAIEIDLSDEVGKFIGDFSVKIDYKLSGVVAMSEGKMILDLPVICGFIYPVKTMQFTITLPGEITTRPMFVASYQQTSTDSLMNVAINGNMISGEVVSPLKDHETMYMTMEVDPEMFRGVSTYERQGNPEIIPMAIFAGLALLYWIFALRTWPLLRTRRATPPEGVSAGELGCRLTFAGADLTMMVFTWAQLGYILIHQDDHGRVWLHKRMEMGNERSLFEVKCFKALFGSRRAVEGTGYQYAKLCRKLAQQVPGERAMCKSNSGNIKLFRIISCGVCVFGGICLAMNMTGIVVLQVILSIILAPLGAFSAWKLQEGMYRIHIRGKIPLYVCTALTVLWILIGLYAGQILIALWMITSQLLAGLAAAYGGRRSDMGRTNAAQVLGLRHYLRTLSDEELQRVLKNDPEFFYNMAPYAIAMGVDGAFSKHFGKRKLRPCPYYISGLQGKRTAQEWAKAMRETADLLDARQRQMELERYAFIRIR